MSIFSPTKPIKEQSKVHYSEYVKAQDTPNENDEKPAEEPLNPAQPESS